MDWLILDVFLEKIKKMHETENKKDEEKKISSMTHALVRHSDMAPEMRTEAMELCIVACEKFPEDKESATKLIKEEMDKKFNGHWHAVVGEGYGFEVTHEMKKVLYMFFGGNLAILVWCM